MKKIIKKILEIFKPTYKYFLNINYVNSKLLDGKNVIVTGGTSGIGYEIARRAIELGANVIITGRDKEKLEKAKQKLNCEILLWDISKIDEIDKNIKEIKNKFEKVDCFVNNAGIYLDTPYLECCETEYTSIMDINLKGIYFSTQKMISEFFIPQNFGNIIMISSNRGIMGDDRIYGIAKAAINHLTKGIAKDYLNKNIRINAIAPGMTTSNINRITDNENLYASFLKGKRVLSSKEIAEITTFFISDISTCITGQVIECDNGESII